MPIAWENSLTRTVETGTTNLTPIVTRSMPPWEADRSNLIDPPDGAPSHLEG